MASTDVKLRVSRIDWTMLLGRRAFLIASVIGGVSPAMGQTLYELYQNSVSKRPYVSFLARWSPGKSGVPGHSFVGFGVELDNGLTIFESLLGFYPIANGVEIVKAVYSTTSGELKQNIEDVSWDVEFRVFPNEQEYSKAKDIAKKWLGDAPEYNLFADGGKNCSVFAAEVAQSLGLQTPTNPGATLPVSFIQALKEANEK